MLIDFGKERLLKILREPLRNRTLEILQGQWRPTVAYHHDCRNIFQKIMDRIFRRQK